MASPDVPAGQRGWFVARESDSTTQEALRTVKDVENTHGQFRQRIDQLLGKEKAKKRATTKDELLKQLQDLSPDDLSARAIVELKDAGRQLSFYTKERKSGARKFGAQTQNFFKTFADFVGAYSGIISLVRGAGAPYGEAAYETLSLLLIIVVNKSANDSKMGDLIRDLAVAFPRLDVLMSVYPSSNLEACVAAVYVNVIMFAREAVEYYSHFEVRFLKSITKPPSVGIDITTSTIKGKLAEVNAEAMIQLHARNQKILESVTNLEDENARLIKKVSDLQDSSSRLEDGIARLEIQNGALEQELRSSRVQLDFQAEATKQERLDKLRSTFKLFEDPNSWPEMDIPKIHNSLLQTFPGSTEGHDSIRLHAKHRSHRFQHMTRERILMDPKYLDWYASERSSLLFLCGHTELEGRSNSQSASSWLSPAAVFAAKRVQLESGGIRAAEQQESQSPDTPTMQFAQPNPNMSNDLCLFYSCQPNGYASGASNHDTIRPLSVLVWAICGWGPAALTGHVEDFRSRADALMKTKEGIEKREREIDEEERHVNDKKEMERDKRKILKGVISLLVEMLQKASERRATVWIFLDRLDQCDIKLYYIMSQFERLLACSGPRVKILVTSDERQGDGKWDAKDLEACSADQIFLHDQWDQQRMTAFERSSENLRRMDSAWGQSSISARAIRSMH